MYVRKRKTNADLRPSMKKSNDIVVIEKPVLDLISDVLRTLREKSTARFF